MKPKHLAELKAAGINWLALGIESKSKFVRDGVAKGRFNDEDIYRIVQQIKDAGIHVIGNYIFGLPDDNFQTMNETLNMALEMNCEMANFYSAMAYPGSQLYDMAVKESIALPETVAGLLSACLRNVCRWGPSTFRRATSWPSAITPGPSTSPSPKYLALVEGEVRNGYLAAHLGNGNPDAAAEVRFSNRFRPLAERFKPACRRDGMKMSFLRRAGGVRDRWNVKETQIGWLVEGLAIS